jgi:hypothetical protein
LGRAEAGFTTSSLLWAMCAHLRRKLCCLQYGGCAFIEGQVNTTEINPFGSLFGCYVLAGMSSHKSDEKSTSHSGVTCQRLTVASAITARSIQVTAGKQTEICITGKHFSL